MLDQPPPLAGQGRQASLGVDGDREADRFEQRQVAGRVGVGDGLVDAQPLGAAVVVEQWAKAGGAPRPLVPFAPVMVERERRRRFA